MIQAQKVDSRWVACRDFGYHYIVHHPEVPKWQIIEKLEQEYGNKVSPNSLRVYYKKRYHTVSPWWGEVTDSHGSTALYVKNEQVVTFLTLLFS